MTEMEKLARWHDGMAVWPVQERHTAAAATIRAAMAEIERLRDALRPFARFLDCLEVMGKNTPKTGVWYEVESSVVGERSLTIEDFAAARAALKAPAHD